ncbi:histone-lysine N-methyltransferase, H3 lysine-9 specific SUVH4-like protein [Tanacetum coccineum]
MLGAMTNAVSNDNEVCPKCKNKKHNGDCWKCGKCGKLGHKTAACRCPDKRDVTCFNCNKKGHLKRDCPNEKVWSVVRNNVEKLQVRSYGCSTRSESRYCTLIDIEPVELDTSYEVELADGKVEVNSRAKIQSNKTTNSNNPVDQKSHTQKPSRQIFTGHRFSPNKTSAVSEKTSPRSDLRWKPTSRIFKSVGLRVRFLQESTSINVQKEQSLDLSAEVHQAAETVTTSNELDLLFGPLFDEYFNGENQVVLKSSAVNTTDASNKRQQQPDSTSSTSTLATTVTANGNFYFVRNMSFDPIRTGGTLPKGTLIVEIQSLGSVVAIENTGSDVVGMENDDMDGDGAVNGGVGYGEVIVKV